MRHLEPEQPLPEQEYELVVYSRNRNGEVVYGTVESNHITTAKYTFFSLIPLTFFIQFRRKANVYFFGITALGAVADYVPDSFDSTMNISAMIVAIMMIFGAAMAKEGFDDYYRGQDDKKFNQQPFLVLSKPEGDDQEAPVEQQLPSEELAVASLVKVVEGESFPVDMLFLLSSEDDGACFVDTKNLDGETNLKHRTSCGAGWFTTPGQLLHTDLELTYSPPTPVLGAFVGTVRNTTRDEARAVGPDQLLLRGTCLRNTAWVIGVVVYNGQRTKLAQNLIESPAKRSSLDTQTDGVMICMFMCQFTLVTFATICYLIFSKDGDAEDQWYLCSGDLDVNPEYKINHLFAENCDSDDGSQSWWQQWLSFLILYNNFISISLYLMMEFAVVVQAFFIGQDVEMYYEEFDSPALARNSNLTTDLGRVDYVFSDKTGTLTRNEMTLHHCALHAMSLSTDEMLSIVEAPQHLDSNASVGVRALLTAIAVNHTILVARDESAGADDPTTPYREQRFSEEYLAESPDEKALLEGARACGVRLLDRTNDECLVQMAGQTSSRAFRVLATIPFDSARKRMSVLVATPDSPDFKLVCKGADSVLLDNLACSCDRIGGRDAIDQALSKYSVEGLRTLVYAERSWPKRKAEDWLERWEAAIGSNVDRQARLEALAAEAEQDLYVLGATAVEDRLQEGVPSTMADLKAADMKVWVLTGDKTDTAINISFSCRLLTPSTHLVRLTGLKGPLLRKYLRLWARAFLKLDSKSDKSTARQDLLENLNLERLSEQYKPAEEGLTDGLTQAFSSLKGTPAPADEAAADGLLQALVEPLLAPEDEQEAKTGKSAALDAGPTSPTQGGDPLGVARSSAGQVLAPGEVSAVPKDQLAVIVDGSALDQIFGNVELEAMLFAITSAVGVVVACRVSPKHKSLMVKLVKEWSVRLPLTLAIGDGANDVAMIQEAHVGVGISGKEGRQAVNSSDYAICQFRYLKRLLLVHGRWNIDRTSKLVWFQIQQNVTLVVPLIAFTAVCSWSGTIAYTEFGYQFFNFFLGIPVLCLAWFDRSEPDTVLMANPKLYVQGRDNPLLSQAGIFRMISRCVSDGLLVYFGTACSYFLGVWYEGYSADLALFSFMMINALFYVMAVRLVRVHCTFNHFTVAAFIFGLLLFNGSLFIVSALQGNESGLAGYLASFVGASWKTYKTANAQAATWVFYFNLAFVLASVLILDVIQLTILDKFALSWISGWESTRPPTALCDDQNPARYGSSMSATNGRVGLSDVSDGASQLTAEENPMV